MRRYFAQCAFVVLSLAVLGADSSAQSRCGSAKTSKVAFEQRTEFPGSVRRAKTLFVGVYHINPQSGLIDPPPPDSLDKVEAAPKQWPLVGEKEEQMLRS